MSVQKLTPEEFDALFDAFQRTVFRLEALPAYDMGGHEAEGLKAFREGLARPERSVRTSAWVARIAVSTMDFWLFDSSDLYIAHYDTDGTWLGVEPIDDQARVHVARQWRDDALRLAQPWSDYIAARPELARRLPPLHG